MLTRDDAAGPARVATQAANPAAALGEQERIRALRRMKVFAAGLLVFAAVVYVAARHWETSGGPTVAGYVAAAAEAGMVGALADWFAVTALFRRPLGLPIPHTAIIPTRKAALGRSLEQFVAANFLSEPVVRTKIASVGVAERIGGWLADRPNAERATGELSAVVKGSLTVLRDEDVQDVIESIVVRRLADQPVGPPAGRVLEQVVTDGTHHPAVDLVMDSAYRWLLGHRELVLRVVSEQAPGWSPRFVDRRVAFKVYNEVTRFVSEVNDDPQHQVRLALDNYLGRFAADLCSDPQTMARADAWVRRALGSAAVRRAVAALWDSVRRVLIEAVDDPASELRVRIADGLAALGVRLRSDADLRNKVDRWAEDAGAHLVYTYRDEVATVISDTVNRWDAAEASRKIEIHVGRDLQFIRINGTVVGALAGLVIHAVTVLVL